MTHKHIPFQKPWSGRKQNARGINALKLAGCACSVCRTERRSVPQTVECGPRATEQSRGGEHRHHAALDEATVQSARPVVGPSFPGLSLTWTWLSHHLAGSLTFPSITATGFPGPSWNIGPFRWFLNTAVTSQADFRNHTLPWLLYSLSYLNNLIFLFSPEHKLWAEGLSHFPAFSSFCFMSGGRTLALSFSVQQTGRYCPLQSLPSCSL